VRVDGGRAVIDWSLDFTAADGTRVRMDPLALQPGEGDRMVGERSVYGPAAAA
jgi:hypothetical protein